MLDKIVLVGEREGKAGKQSYKWPYKWSYEKWEK